MSTLAPHQQRVVDERAELSDRLSKLLNVFQTPIFVGLDAAEKARLRSQARFMDGYCAVLEERIAAFNAPSVTFQPAPTRVLTEHSGCGQGAQVDQLSVTMHPGDRVLLELAAKAAGARVLAVHERPDGTWLETDAGFWSSMQNDAHALRLAVSLEIEVRNFNGKSHAGQHDKFWCSEGWFPDGDRFAATRRAITRAAAHLAQTTACQACGDDAQHYVGPELTDHPGNYCDTCAPGARLANKVRDLTRCAAGRDGDCTHAQCPQLRDGEPHKSSRHCPLDA